MGEYYYGQVNSSLRLGTEVHNRLRRTNKMLESVNSIYEIVLIESHEEPSWFERVFLKKETRYWYTVSIKNTAEFTDQPVIFRGDSRQTELYLLGVQNSIQLTRGEKSS